ncbi:hypothetical protein K469DRAFT_744562 [Zopfia rhizophila CBS 207.26]|uniref:Uncharacterized protein n=1 Tax=Zopfia rhizophila CBS 207.26 TaxID=1314779 RepID=A0A6A6ETY1_9PEZI|nr:hypothetical protein K469DRAFT_744562 [Zopfia rhizophila CBS 207.26]
MLPCPQIEFGWSHLLVNSCSTTLPSPRLAAFVCAEIICLLSLAQIRLLWHSRISRTSLYVQSALCFGILQVYNIILIGIQLRLRPISILPIYMLFELSWLNTLGFEVFMMLRILKPERTLEPEQTLPWIASVFNILTVITFPLQFAGCLLAFLTKHVQLGRALALSGGSSVHILVAVCVTGLIHGARISKIKEALKTWWVAAVCLSAGFAGIGLVHATTDLFLLGHCVIGCFANISILLSQVWKFRKNAARQNSLNMMEGSSPHIEATATCRSSLDITEGSSPDLEATATRRSSLDVTEVSSPDTEFATSPIHSSHGHFPFDQSSAAESLYPTNSKQDWGV